MSELEEEKKANTMEKKRKKLWIATEAHLIGIDMMTQQFTIRVWFNGFWEDKELADKIRSTGGEIKGDDVIKTYDKFLPFTPNCLHNGSETENKSPPKLKLYDCEQSENVIQLIYDFKSIIHQRFYIKPFPFDAQFLDIQFVFRVTKFLVLKAAPQYIQQHDYHLDLPIIAKMADSMTEYRLCEPWMDFRENIIGFKNEETYQFKYSLLRLRVVRDPGYYLEYIIIPLWLIVSVGCCCRAIDTKDIADRLGFLVTLLLTVVAFQYSVQECLPNTSTVTLIDIYTFVAIIIVCVLIIHVSFVSGILVDDEEDVIPNWINLYDTGIIFGFTIVWCIYSAYLILHGRWMNKNVDWETLSDSKMKDWTEMHKTSRFKRAEKGKVFGSNMIH